jgi:hypothetical protein
MRRGSIFVILLIIVAAVVIGASQFLKSQPPLEITVAVDPLAVAWAEKVTAALNATAPVVNATQRVQFKVTPRDDLEVWAGERLWTPDNHPAAWIPASSASLGYAQENGLSISTLAASVARTPLVWGGYLSRVDVLTNGGTAALDWAAVQKGAAAESWSKLGGQADWQFIKLGFPQPGRKMGGLAVLFSGAAAFNQKTDLVGADIRSSDFRNWMLPVIESVPNFTTLGSDLGAAMARGPSTVEIGLFPEAQWLLNLTGMLKWEDVRLTYPAYQFGLDFPLIGWTDANVTADQREAITLLQNWLLDPAQQAKLPDYGLRPASDDPTEKNALFAAGVPYGIQLALPPAQPITVPNRSDVQTLIQWVSSNQ